MKLVKPTKKSAFKGHINMMAVNCYNLYNGEYLTARRPGEHRFFAQVKDNGEFFDYLLECLRQKKQYNLIHRERKKLTISDIQQELRFRLQIVKRTLPDESTILLTYSYSDGYWILLQDMMYKILAEVDDDIELDVTINDYAFAVKQMMLALSNLRESKLNLSQFNPAPSYYIKFPNGVFNNKTKKFVPKEHYKKYHFTKAIDWQLVPIHALNPLYSRIIHRMITDWADENDEVKSLIWQMAVAAIEGNGRGKTIIVKSDGGGGKTSFQNILKAIVGFKSVLNCGIYELNNDNKLANLKADTHLIIGDDADTNKKMPALSLSRLKSLSDGGSFLIDVKYEASRTVMSNALFIQNTNTDLAIYENNQALASRMVKLNWTNRNFRQEKDDFEFDLKELIGNPLKGTKPNREFIEAFTSIALFETPYFKDFIIPKSVEEDTLEMLAENDQVNAYVGFLEQQDILKLPYLSLNTEYQRYVDWLKDINSSAKPLKKRNFSKEFEINLIRKGFKVYDEGKFTRPSQLGLANYNNKVINYLTDYTIHEKTRTQTKFFTKSDNVISEQQINNIKNKEHLDKYNPIHRLIYFYLVDVMGNVEFMDKFMDEMEN